MELTTYPFPLAVYMLCALEIIEYVYEYMHGGLKSLLIKSINLEIPPGNDCAVVSHIPIPKILGLFFPVSFKFMLAVIGQ